jgi:hypothetical protein
MAVVASATNATNATNATTATNASSLGGTAAAGYVKNTGNQTFSGGVTFKSGMTVSGLASVRSQLFVYPDVGDTPNWVLVGSDDIFTGSATLQCYTDGSVKHNVITVNNATGDISFGGTATRANKLGTATVGASNKPIYLSAGIPVSMSVVASAGTATNATNYVSGGGSATIASIGGNGKTVRFPGGLQICYGSGTIATSGTDVSFGSAFSETPSIMVTARPGSAPTVTHCGAVVSASTTGAKLYFTDGSTLRGGNYFYTATGKWK